MLNPSTTCQRVHETAAGHGVKKALKEKEEKELKRVKELALKNAEKQRLKIAFKVRFSVIPTRGMGRIY